MAYQAWKELAAEFGAELKTTREVDGVTVAFYCWNGKSLPHVALLTYENHNPDGQHKVRARTRTGMKQSERATETNVRDAFEFASKNISDSIR